MKNFQIVSEKSDEVVMQFGKVGADIFTMDFRSVIQMLYNIYSLLFFLRKKMIIKNINIEYVTSMIITEMRCPQQKEISPNGGFASLTHIEPTAQTSYLYNNCVT